MGDTPHCGGSGPYACFDCTCGRTERPLKRGGLIYVSANRIDRRTWPRVTRYRLGEHGRVIRKAWHLRSRFGTVTIDVRTGVDHV